MKKYEALPLAEVVEAAELRLSVNRLPDGLSVLEGAGLIAAPGLDGVVVHRTPEPSTPLYEVRATLTPGGDYLLMFPEGQHYGHSKEKANNMLAYRSKDGGKTWEGPTLAFDIDYNQHAFIPFIPRGSKRIYAFGTQPIWGMYTYEHGLNENAPIGYRYSDNDGHTWSEVRLIRPENDPTFRGMSVMRMCETEKGTWLLGSHEGDWSYKPLMTRQYVLRSEDQGATWELLPGRRHGGWGVLAFNRMDEGRPIHVGGDRVFMTIRTPEGHLWSTRSEDDGKTWEQPAPMPLVHPDAPSMIFHLSDGKTLVVFHHNRHHDLNYAGLGDKAEIMKDRSEMWVSFSEDEGLTWSEPRFLFVNALEPTLNSSFRNYQCSYMDMFLDGDLLNLFVPHRWQQVLHLTIRESDLRRLPTRAELRAMVE
ncbi:sialidase family protein [Paenibacillus koleovorans]|uniref:sialidase family protein n=1 Tax=Paenibacillus koleovorans TaxID=121608 RepID=UPI0013E3535F|nr:sialidase family protein [Paenibacillus koleovorans]